MPNRQLTFFGTRGVFPVGSQMSCAWVDAPDAPFVIDLGSSRLFDDPVRIASIEHVLLTHLHPDHIAFLASLIIERLNLPDATRDCLFVAPEPLRAYMEFCDLQDVPGYRQVEEPPATWCGFSLETMRTNHPKPNFAYRFSDGGRSTVWTGDCSWSEELAAFCAGADTVICEASMREERMEQALEWGHMTPSLFARLMNEARPARAVATHFMEMDPPEFIGEVRPLLDSGIELVAASDGLSIEL